MKKSIEELRWFQPDNLFKYPHMFGLEARVMDSWISQYKSIIKRMAYDIPVGFGRAVDPQSTLKLDAGAKYSTSFKMDALADIGLYFYIIEVKGIATLEGYGQLLSYIHLFKESYEITKPCHLKLLCTSAHPDLISVGKIHNIEVIECDISTV